MTTRRPVSRNHQRPRLPSASSTTDRATDYGSVGWGFESLLARKIPAHGRLAQRESVRFTPGRSLVRSQYRPRSTPMVGVAQSGQSSGLWTRASPVRIRSLTLVLRRTLKPDPGRLPEWTKGAVCKTVGLAPALVRTQHLPRHGLYGTHRMCRGRLSHTWSWIAGQTRASRALSSASSASVSSSSSRCMALRGSAGSERDLRDQIVTRPSSRPGGAVRAFVNGTVKSS